jgi:hypothetical protein
MPSSYGSGNEFEWTLKEVMDGSGVQYLVDEATKVGRPTKSRRWDAKIDCAANRPVVLAPVKAPVPVTT